VPAEAEESVRDLVRARAALLADRKRALGRRRRGRRMGCGSRRRPGEADAPRRHRGRQPGSGARTPKPARAALPSLSATTRPTPPRVGSREA